METEAQCVEWRKQPPLLDYRKQRGPMVSVVAFMGLVKGKGVNFHVAFPIGQANRPVFLYSTSISPQNNSEDPKRRNWGPPGVWRAGSRGSSLGSTLPLPLETVWLFWWVTELP